MFVKPTIIVSIAIVFSLLHALTLGLTEHSSKAQTKLLNTYNDTQGRFVVQYPTTWEIAPKNSSFPYYGSDTAIVFKPVDETTNPLENTLFSIAPIGEANSIDGLSLSVSPDSLDRIVSGQIEFMQDPSSIYGALNVEILQNNSTTVNGLPAKELTYLVHGIGSFEVQTFVINDDKLYQLTFQTPETRVPYTLPAAQQMIDTLKFTS
jgi:hypothetical protein